MCGIIGQINKHHRASFDQIRPLVDLLAHRGPDDRGEWSDQKAFLGHRRLSIFDLSEKGHQPMLSSNGRFVIVFNGEIYNFKELQRQLDYPCQTNTDTEVVLAYWAKYGANAIEHFNGMFAFCIWDTLTDTAHIVRDRVGVKPLYFLNQDRFLAFSSEIRPLINLIPKPKLDQTALPQYMLYGSVSAPRTIVEGVEMLEPGHYLRIDAKGVEKHRYWSPEPSQASLEESLTDAVDLRMLADVPVGVFLSGGLDSSIISALAARTRTQAIDTFSIGFDRSEYDESEIAALVAKKIGSNHHRLQVNMADCLSSVEAGLKALDHPSVDGLNTFIVAGETKRAGMTVALSGLGGDELFAGYPAIFQRSKALASSSLGNQDWLRLIASSIMGLRSSVKSQKFKSILDLESMDAVSIADASRYQLLPDQVKKLLRLDCVRGHSVEKGNNYSSITLNELRHYLPDVLLRDSDQMGMAHALEIRVPFLDHRVVEASLGMNDRQKAARRPKEILIKTFGHLLPKEVWQRKKMGFELPWAVWMKSELQPLVDQSFNTLKQHACFDADELSEIYNSFYTANAPANWSRVWLLVVLSNWMTENGIE